MKKILLFLFLAISLKTKSQDIPENHYQGVELGYNSYCSSIIGKSSMPVAYEGLKLKTNIANIKLNILSPPVLRKRVIGTKPGVTTFYYAGAGIEWLDYRFARDDVRLNADSASLIAYYDNQYENIKSKLILFYINVPLMIEHQFNYNCYVSGGVDLGYKLSSRSKVKYKDNEDNKTVRNSDDFYINSFKPTAIFSIGFGFIGLKFSYSLTSLFQKNKGPSLYPFGINLVFTANAMQLRSKN